MINRILASIAAVALVNGLVSAQEPVVPVTDQASSVAGELVNNGFVLAVNGDAISSTDIIEKVYDKLEAIGIDNYKVFYTKAFPIIRETVMSDIYDLLMYQYSRQSMEKDDVDEDVIEKAREKRKKEIIRDHGGNEPITHIELKKAGTTMEAELDKFMRKMIISGYKDVYLSSDQSVSRLEVLDYYENHRKKFTIAAKIQFRLIELDGKASDAMAKAQAVLARLQAGEDFATIAQELSSDWKAKSGGLWNELDPASIKKVYQPVIEQLVKVQPGTLTPIVATEGKLYIARLESYTPAALQPLADVQETIRRDVLENRWVQYTEKLSEKLLDRAIIGDVDHFIAGTLYTAWKKLGGKEELEIIDTPQPN